MSDAELSFRGQDDYISKYRRVLEYFDAVKVGLTATPALHTTEIFGDPIFTYSYRQAVIDGFLIDHEPPMRIETALARAGIVFEKDKQLDLLNTKTGEVNLAHAPDEIRFEVEQFNRRVMTAEFNRVVAEELANHIENTICWLHEPNLFCPGPPPTLHRTSANVSTSTARRGERL